MDAKFNPETGAAGRSIVTTRIYDAPRELVFDAWVDVEHISEWWGPHGFTTTTSEFDLRPGGAWRFTMHGPDGRDYQNLITYEEIARPERLVYRHGGADAALEPVQFRVTVTLEDLDGRTKLTMQAVFPSAAERNRVAEEYGAVEGAAQTLARFARLIESHRGAGA